MRFGWSSCLLPLLLAPLLVGQQSVPPTGGDAVQARTKAYTLRREAALSPVWTLVRQGDYLAARSAVTPILATYPHDLRVLFLAADILRIDGDFEQALALYQQCLDLKTEYQGAIHLGRVRTYADMGRWADFNQERVVVRQLALAGDETLSVDHGYLVEDHRDSRFHMEVLEFPAVNDASSITRFRFLFLAGKTPTPDFVPSIDLEANPADAPSFARRYPRGAAAHVRAFALASYPDIHTREFDKFYPEGEPPYEDVRTDVVALAPGLVARPAPGKPPADAHRPAYRPAPTTSPQPLR